MRYAVLEDRTARALCYTICRPELQGLPARPRGIESVHATHASIKGDLPVKVCAIVMAGIIGFAVNVVTAAADGTPAPMYYPNGDSAVATDGCGPGDLCATITLAGGDSIKVLTGGSGRCNPYVMTFMRYHGDALDRVWSTPTDRNPDSPGSFGSGAKCGSFRNTHMAVDSGAIDMGIFQKTDGTIFVQFFGGSTTPPPTPEPTLAPSPQPPSSPTPVTSPAPSSSPTAQIS